MENELRSKIKELLETGQVKLAIGYTAENGAASVTPFFAESPEDVDKMVWTPLCFNNLTTYLPQMAKGVKTAIVVKPCDGKSIVELIREKQISRDDVFIISMPCPGVMNPALLHNINPSSVVSIEWGQDGILINTSNGTSSFQKEQAFAAKCGSCTITESPIYDLKIGESPDRSPWINQYESVEELEKLSPAERLSFWAEQFRKCIRCYACRQVCPMCYCTECFTDKKGQVWVSRATNIESNWFYHMGRAMHMAGRCIGCGECERACPVNIPLTTIYKMLKRDTAELFGREPGTDPDALPIFGSFDEKDPDPCPE